MSILPFYFLLIFIVIIEAGYYDNDLMQDHLILIKQTNPKRIQPKVKLNEACENVNTRLSLKFLFSW